MMVTFDSDNAIIRIHKRRADELGYTELQLQNLKSDLSTMCIGLAHLSSVAWRVVVVP